MGFAIFIPVKGPIESVTKRPTFKALQTYIDGYVEAVYLTLTPDQVAVAQFNCNDPELDKVAAVIEKPKKVTWICNEEGKIQNLPENLRATELMNLDFPIVGNVVLFVGFTI